MPATKLKSELWKITPHSLKTSKIASAASGTLFLHSLARSSSGGLLASGGGWEDFSTRKHRLMTVQDHGKQTYKDHHLSKSCARVFAGPSCTSSKKSTM